MRFLGKNDRKEAVRLSWNLHSIRVQQDIYVATVQAHTLCLWKV